MDASPRSVQHKNYASPFFPRSLLITDDHRPATRKQKHENVEVDNEQSHRVVACNFHSNPAFFSIFSTIPWICFHVRHLYNHLLHLHRYSPRLAAHPKSTQSNTNNKLPSPCRTASLMTLESVTVAADPTITSHPSKGRRLLWPKKHPLQRYS